MNKPYLISLLILLLIIPQTFGKQNLLYINTKKYVQPNTIFGFKYTSQLLISNLNNFNLNDFQVKIILNSSWDGWNYIQPDGRDIRFILNDSTTNIPYWIEEWDYSNKKSIIWVKIPNIPKNSQIKIYMYYGNPNVQSESNGYQVFEFFDDFEGNTINSSKWVVYSSNYSISNSILRINNGNIELKNSLPFDFRDGYIGEVKVIFYQTEDAYSGVLPEICSSSYTGSSNSNSDATILYMRPHRESTNPKDVYYWIGDGSTNRYNIVSATYSGWTSEDNVWYITGVSVNGGTVKLWRDYSIMKTVTGVNWKKPLKYIELGLFTRKTDGNIQDTGYDWVRIRKYVDNEPTVQVGKTELSKFIVSIII